MSEHSAKPHAERKELAMSPFMFRLPQFPSLTLMGLLPGSWMMEGK